MDIIFPELKDMPVEFDIQIQGMQAMELLFDYLSMAIPLYQISFSFYVSAFNYF
jgi:hypothetical protein